ncbi:MAG: MIP family channel protein [Proteobacteria bacterium]|nr:MIP family channel protein [Pseudomonadota bacterium]MBU1687323.1 MIP family channel protein [Pseudomonadota bacterium]
MRYSSEFFGELVGTFILVFFGCGSVAVTVLFSAHNGLFQVATIWGMGVTLAIYATRHLSCAHLNPAVSLAMVLGRRMSVRRLPAYLGAQFFGAFLAAVVLYTLFAGSIAAYETSHAIVRGTPDSIKTAMIFGEFYPNPGSGRMATVSHWNAFAAEAMGSFLLVSMIFALTEGCNVGRPHDALAPLFIGITVTAIICVLAPLTQAGLNPARDLAPRLFAWLAGWGQAAFPDDQYGFVTVYVLGPLAGGAAAALLFVRFLEPMMSKKNNLSCCD